MQIQVLWHWTARKLLKKLEALPKQFQDPWGGALGGTSIGLCLCHTFHTCLQGSLPDPSEDHMPNQGLTCILQGGTATRCFMWKWNGTVGLFWVGRAGNPGNAFSYYTCSMSGLKTLGLYPAGNHPSLPRSHVTCFSK